MNGVKRRELGDNDIVGRNKRVGCDERKEKTDESVGITRKRNEKSTLPPTILPTRPRHRPTITHTRPRGGMRHRVALSATVFALPPA